MSAVLPHKTATTNTIKNSCVDVMCALTDGYLLYQPDKNAFIALYPEEWFTCCEAGEANNLAIQELQEANQAVTDKSLALINLRRQPSPAIADLKQAQMELDQALSTLSAKSEAAKKRIEKITDLETDSNKLVEVLPLTRARKRGQKAFYIPAVKLKAALDDQRFFIVNGPAERSKPAKEKLLNGSALNAAEIKRRIAENVRDKAKFSKKWKLKPQDADEYAGQFFSEWSQTMGAQAKEFLEREHKLIAEGIFNAISPAINTDPNDPHRNIDLKSEAQLLRWAAGAGLEANFLPFQGNLYDKRDKNWQSRFKRVANAAQFNVKANAEASFAIGEAKVQTIGYYPHFAGWHAEAAAPGIALDLGHFRFRGDMTLYAVAGASIALEAGAALMLTGGQQGLRGTPKSDKSAKAKVGGKGEVKLFAGLKEGIGLAGAMQWLNPEGFIDPKSPKKKDLHSTWGEYVDVGLVSADASLIQGLAATLGLEIDYRSGSFVIAAKAGGCLGLGGEGALGAKVGVAHVGEFFMCVAHQLKQADYTKLTGLMEERIFKAYNQILFMVMAQGRALSSFVDNANNSLDLITKGYQGALNAAKQQGADFIKKLETKMRAKWGWYAYMPPEARGAMLASIRDVIEQPQYASNYDLKVAAAFCVNELISTTQTGSHLDNTLDRITVAMGDAPGSGAAIASINAILAGTSFANTINRAEIQLAKAQPLIQRPFLRNDEPSFYAAQFPLQHPTSMA